MIRKCSRANRLSVRGATTGYVQCRQALDAEPTSLHNSSCMMPLCSSNVHTGNLGTDTDRWATCPTVCVENAMICVQMLLMLSGDVECNPGPNHVEEMLKELLKGQKDLIKDVSQIKANQSTFQKELGTVKLEIKELRNTLMNLQESRTELQNMAQEMKLTIQQQQQKIIDLEDRQRRNNLVVFGITENASETSDELKQKVLCDVFEKRLDVKVSSVERIHRLGKKNGNKARAVIIKFFDYNEKMAILKNCKKLKGTKISVSNDYSQATSQKRRNLWASTKIERERGVKVRLVHDRAFIDNEAFAWDNERGCRVKLDRQHASEDESA